MTQNKRFSALLLALAIFVALLPQAYFLLQADARNDSGQCGPKLYWTLQMGQGGDNDVLTITGSGKMWDYDVNVIHASDGDIEEGTTAPWSSYPDEIRLPEGLTSIGAYAFFEGAPREVTIPESVTQIGRCAFAPNYLENITINNKDCEIYDEDGTLGDSQYVTVHGFIGSTAHAYALKYGYRFEPLSGSIGFVDVVPGSYYEEAVNWAVGHDPQITNGVDATNFSPDASCTRGQVVTFLWRANGEPAPKSTSHPFVDLDQKAFYYKAVLWAVEKKITNGIDDTHFKPNDTCTRAQVVTFLWRSKG